MKYVYIDTYVIENLLMNYIILYITSRVLNIKTKWYAYFPGAIIGSLYAVITLWSNSNFAVLIGKILVSIIMIYITNHRYIQKDLIVFAKVLATFYAVTFIFAGTAFAVMMSVKVKNAYKYILSLGVAYLIIDTFAKYRQERNLAKSQTRKVYIQFEKEKNIGIWLSAIIDTGNMLKDPFSGKKVIVAEQKEIEKILPENITNILKIKEEKNMYTKEEDLENMESEWKKRFRVIPYNAVGVENGILPGFKADIVKIDEQEIGERVVCIYKKSLSSNNEYSALLPPDLIM